MTAMLPTLGSLSLFVAVLAFIAAWIFYRNARPDSPGNTGYARKAVALAVIALLVASAALIWLLFARDYNVAYVYSYVGNDLPSLYVLSAFWAGQEGSFLLWALFAAALGYLLCIRTGDWEAPVMRVYIPSAVVLVVLTIISGPFEVVSRVVADGVGLNPLLRDPWMAIHPPVAFIGYAAMSIPFAYAIAGLGWKNGDDWVRQALPWTLLGWVTLGTGIIMGGFWAYKVLGWGGWWGWDPVENASLLPWLTGTALFHGLLLQRSRRKLPRTNILLAVLTFGLVIYSTFLTRSGVLEGASVHTFGVSAVGLWAGLWMVAVIGYGAYRLYTARTEITGERIDEPVFSREVLLVVGAVVLVLCAAVIGLGTSAPILSRMTGGEGAAVDISFYGRTTLPLGILIALGMGISVLLPWSGTGSVNRTTLWASMVSGAVAVAGAYLMGVSGLLLLLFAGGAVFALAITLVKLERTLRRQGWRAVGGPISHLGAALMFVAIVASTTGREQKADLIYETPTRIMGYELTFTGWAGEPGGKHSATVMLLRPGDVTPEVVRPKLYRMYGSGRMMVCAEPHISRRFTHDLYIAPVQYLPPDQAVAETGQLNTRAMGGVLTVELSVKPFMSVLWTGVILVLLGGVLASYRCRWAGSPALPGA